MRRRTNISLLALVGAVMAALVFAAAGSSGEGIPPITTTLTLNGDTPITYGQSTTLGGSLTYNNDLDQTVGLPDVPIEVSKSNQYGCAGLSGWVTPNTDSNGDYDAGPFVPDAAGYWSYESYFAGSTGTGDIVYDPSRSDCLFAVVEAAPTQTSVTNTPSTTLALGSSLSVDYKLASAYGIDGNTTGGSVSIWEMDTLDSLGCSTSGDTVSASQNNASGVGAADAGFAATGTLTCTPTAAGSYRYSVSYYSDANYGGSNSAEHTLTVTDKQDQSPLSVTGPESAIFAAPDQTITYTGGSGDGAVTFDAGDLDACSIVDGKLHVTADTGTCTITATKAADDDYNSITSAAFTVSITNSYMGAPGTKTCVKNTLRAEEDEHGSLKAAATEHGFANTTGLRKDITTYCKTPT